jgi:hypothetical protein
MPNINKVKLQIISLKISKIINEPLMKKFNLLLMNKGL